MKLKLFNDFLNERAVTSDDVVSTESETGLIKSHYKRTKEHLKLVLYNFENNTVEGFISLEKIGNDKNYQVFNSYAIDKHGPLMYELVMSITSPEGIIPDRTIRPKAQKVWDFFLNHRSDVKKEEIKKGDDWYATKYNIDADHENLTDPVILNLLNKIYSLEAPIPHANELLKKGEELLKKYSKNTTAIMNAAEKEFKIKYNDDFEN